MTQSDDEEIKLIVLGPSGPRLWLGVGCAAGLGIILFWIVFAGRPAMAYQVSFLVIGALSLFLADQIRRAGQHSIILTNKVLKTETGHVLTTVDNIRVVERGAFTLKPPNGFLVRLHQPSGRGWIPGLWWQRGRALGVGGVVPAGKSRAMAEAITVLKMGELPPMRAS